MNHIYNQLSDHISCGLFYRAGNTAFWDYIHSTGHMRCWTRTRSAFALRASNTLLTLLIARLLWHLYTTAVTSALSHDFHSALVITQKKGTCWLYGFYDMVYETWITLGDPSVSHDYINVEVFIEIFFMDLFQHR